MSGTRLNKYIASSGLCSRRKADELIESGVVVVNFISDFINPQDILQQVMMKRAERPFMTCYPKVCTTSNLSDVWIRIQQDF